VEDAEEIVVLIFVRMVLSAEKGENDKRRKRKQIADGKGGSLHCHHQSIISYLTK
jgi:hypothetical protein